MQLAPPLAILRLNTENALICKREEDLKSDLHNILQGIERSDRMIQQLLTLARVENIHSLIFDDVNLEKLIQSVMSDLAPLSLKNSQEMSLSGDDCLIKGDGSLLRILLSNLIDTCNPRRGLGDRIVVTRKLTNPWLRLHF
ncbi:hypothetical protein P4S72_17135 [Vibrio sp. PP-XX7]